MRQFCVKNETILHKKWDNFVFKNETILHKKWDIQAIFLNIDYINNDI